MTPRDELLADARNETGLDDFGDDSFRDGLERLVRSLREEAHLNSTGQASLRQIIVDLLAQRLQVEYWYRCHPEIDDEPIDRPLSGLGLPRTGSTALSHLLAEDQGTRSCFTMPTSPRPTITCAGSSSSCNGVSRLGRGG